jgi:hypothetical protein
MFSIEKTNGSLFMEIIFTFIGWHAFENLWILATWRDSWLLGNKKYCDKVLEIPR